MALGESLLLSTWLENHCIYQRSQRGQSAAQEVLRFSAILSLKVPTNRGTIKPHLEHCVEINKYLMLQSTLDIRHNRLKWCESFVRVIANICQGRSNSRISNKREWKYSRPAHTRINICTYMAAPLGCMQSRNDSKQKESAFIISPWNAHSFYCH